MNHYAEPEHHTRVPGTPGPALRGRRTRDPTLSVACEARREPSQAADTPKEPLVNIAPTHQPRRRGAPAARILAVIALAAAAMASPQPASAADESITVNFSVTGGSPTYRASGWIYGMT